MSGSECTAKANEATKKARGSGSAADHKIAENLHRDAADAHEEEGNKMAADHHRKMADAHATKSGDDKEDEKPPFGKGR